MTRSLPVRLALGAAILFLLVLIALPFWWVLSSSIKVPAEIIARVPTMVPHSFTLQHFQKLLGGSDYPVYMVNSLIVAGLSTLITLLLAVPAA